MHKNLSKLYKNQYTYIEKQPTQQKTNIKINQNPLKTKPKTLKERKQKTNMLELYKNNL